MPNAVVDIVSPAADTVFLNGKIITVKSKDEIAEALAIRGHQILGVGSVNQASDELNALSCYL